MITRELLIGLVRLLVGAAPRWVGPQPADGQQRIYFANHSSHIDTVALWSALPAPARAQTRPVAAADYWGGGRFKRYVALKVLNAVLIDRDGGEAKDPLAPLCAALERGDSLIIFPEGTRRAQALPGAFKSGLFHLAARFPSVQLVPVYLDNLHRSMPKGTFFPVPIVCTVRFGRPLAALPDEDKQAFLARARDAVIELSQ